MEAGLWRSPAAPAARRRGFAAQAADESALTIYSSQQPGAIAADFYWPVPGGAFPAASSVPGFALVRQDRDVQVALGRSSLRFSDVAAFIDPTTVHVRIVDRPGGHERR